jgi:hypothetical protein
MIRVYNDAGNAIETHDQAVASSRDFWFADLMLSCLKNSWEECRYPKVCSADWNTTKIRYVFSSWTIMPRLMKSVLLCLPVVLFTSCATITRGSHETLIVLSEPPGANVVLSSGEKGVTPATFVKSRGDNFTVTVSKAGYVPQTVNVESKVSATGGAAMAGNVGFIVGAPIGVAVDAAKGAYNPSTEPMFPTAKAVPGKPGYVFSPFDTKGRYIDVSGYAPGSKSKRSVDR